jgi:hypothetical protein
MNDMADPGKTYSVKADLGDHGLVGLVGVKADAQDVAEWLNTRQFVVLQSQNGSSLVLHSPAVKSIEFSLERIRV